MEEKKFVLYYDIEALSMRHTKKMQMCCQKKVLFLVCMCKVSLQTTSNTVGHERFFLSILFHFICNSQMKENIHHSHKFEMWLCLMSWSLLFSNSSSFILLPISFLFYLCMPTIHTTSWFYTKSTIVYVCIKKMTKEEIVTREIDMEKK